MASSRPETKFSLLSPGAGRGHRWHRFSKLEKASLKFISLAKNWMGMDWER